VETAIRYLRLAIRLLRRNWCVSPVAIGFVAFAIGCNAPQPEPGKSTTTAGDGGALRRVTGIGGVFFKSDDPARTLEWYRNHLGIASGDWGGFAFQWNEKDQPNETGYTIWSAFPDTTIYFAPSEQPFMVNFRVVDLVRLIAALKDEGVEVVGEIEQHPNGKFAWILDPEGRKVELWEPVASDEDPYLR
jgi:catechol 2,3-dioxygenase-like lactoylglutathione lyase family enzyme